MLMHVSPGAKDSCDLCRLVRLDWELPTDVTETLSLTAVENADCTCSEPCAWCWTVHGLSPVDWAVAKLTEAFDAWLTGDMTWEMVSRVDWTQLGEAMDLRTMGWGVWSGARTLAEFRSYPAEMSALRRYLGAS